MQHYHNERNRKNEKIHNKINIMLHVLYVYNFEVFRMELYLDLHVVSRLQSSNQQFGTFPGFQPVKS